MAQRRERPNYAVARTNLGGALFQKRQLAEAIEQFRLALKLSPNDALAHAYLGVALFQKGQLNDAITELEEALRLNPRLPAVRGVLAKARALLKDGGK